MSQDDIHTPTSQETMEAATRREALHLPGNRPVLIGTFVKPEGNSALVHMNRRIRRVTVGDRIGQTRISAIEDGLVMITLYGNSLRLTLPGDPTPDAA